MTAPFPKGRSRVLEQAKSCLRILSRWSAFPAASRQWSLADRTPRRSADVQRIQADLRGGKCRSGGTTGSECGNAPSFGPARPIGARRGSGKTRAHLGLPSLASVGSSLALVLGLFLIVAWLMRRTTPGSCPVLPSEVVEVLGRAPLTGRQQVHLVRLGRKLVLVCVTPDGVEALSEVVDPVEVDRLAGMCRQSQPNSSTAMFRHTLQQFTGGRRAEAIHG